MRRAINLTTLIFLVITLVSTVNVEPVYAQAGSASDLIAGVNYLRQSKGLTPYTVSSYLMSYAQAHSDYMASLGTWTHVRSDGSTAFDHGIKENVAMGTNMSIDYCIYTVWTDWDHWKTMVSYVGGTVGAGVTIAADNTVYYTLDVLPSDDTIITDYDNEEDSGGEAAPVAQATEIPLSAVATVTPDASGIIIHTVKYGETLYTIAEAYGVTISQILENSSLSAETTSIYVGETLIIQKATEPTSTPTNTATPDLGTATPTQVRPTLTPYPTRTPAPTHTPTTPPSVIHRTLGDGRNVGFGLILVCGLGLLLVIYLGFLKKS